MQRKFLLNLILIIFVNLLIKPFYLFGIDRTVQNAVGSNDYGMYYSLFNLSFILSIILDPGITNYNNRHIAQYTQLLTRYFSSITFIKILLSALYCIILFVWALVSDYPPGESHLFYFIILGQVFNSFVLYNRSNLAGMHLFRADTFISILDKLLMICFCLPLLMAAGLKSSFNIHTFVYLQTLSFFITALVSFFMVKKHTFSFRLKLNLHLFRIILKESYPYAILALLMMVYAKIDTVLLKELHPNGNSEVGIYAAGYRLLDALNMIAVLFSGILYPIFARMIKLKEDLNSLVRLSFSLLVIPSVIFSVGAFFFSTEIMSLLYDQHIEESAMVFRVLILSFISISNSYIFGTLLTANGSIRLLNTFALTGVILNMILNLVLIPSYGSLGSAYASLSTTLIITLLQTLYAFQHGRLRLSGAGLVKMTALIGLEIALVAGSASLDLPWLLRIGGIMLITMAGALALRLIPLRNIMALLKNEGI